MIGFISGFLSVAPSVPRATDTPRYTRPKELDYQANDSIRSTLKVARDLRAELVALREDLGARPTAGKLEVRSSSPVDAIPDETFSVLRSSEQVNSRSTSIETYGPDFGVSTTSPTLFGTYDGSEGDDTIKLEVQRGGVIGDGSGKNRKVRVERGDGSRIKTITVKKADPPGTLYDTGIGLQVSFGPGELIKPDGAFFDVFAATDDDYQTANPFNGQGDTNPRLDDGFVINDGSFDLNGSGIAVNASDSLEDVINRINTAGLGVTASFDVATDEFRLTQDTLGNEAITLGSDSSGFLAAMKLDSAVLEVGVDEDDPMNTYGPTASITAGTLTINDVDVAIDPSTDSFLDVVAAINASGSGVTAAWNDVDGKLTLRPQNPGGSIDLDSGGTNFFEALNITPKFYSSAGGDGGLGYRARKEAIDQMGEMAGAFNKVFDDLAIGGRNNFMDRLRGDLMAAVGDVADKKGAGFKSPFGFGFNFTKTTAFDFRVGRHRNDFDHALRKDFDAVSSFFLGDEDSEGLLDRFIAAIDKADNRIVDAYDGVGVIVNTFA
jgi:hypothetical protein